MKWPTYLNNYVDKLVTSFLFQMILNFCTRLWLNDTQTK